MMFPAGANRLVALAIIAGIFFPFKATAAEAFKKEDTSMQNPFGVLEFLHWNHRWNSYKYATMDEVEKAVLLMKKAGVGIVRMDFVWDDIEHIQGEFDFLKYDNIVGLLNKNGIEILGILDYSASWAAAKWNDPPQNTKLFVDYASKVVERYKTKIKYWEIWNEPDSHAYWSDQDGLKGYCALLKETYLALKKVDPECKILNGGLAGGLASINLLYDNGAKDYFDILNIHFFESPLNPNAIKAVLAYPVLAHKIMSRNADYTKKIWISEIGSPGVRRGLRVRNWWMGKNPNERQQSAWLKEVYNELLKEGLVEKIFWAFFRDTKCVWNNGVDYFGLVRWDFSVKPSFSAYKKCSDSWKSGH